MSDARKTRHFGLLFVGSRKVSGEERFFSVLEEALSGGADAFLLREKDLGGGELLRMAKRAREMTRAHGALLLLSDRIDVALAAGADGVHLPENSFTPKEARRLVGAERLVGRSVHDREGALAAERGGADFLVLGPLFETPGKERFRLGAERAAEVARQVEIPVTAIGGIDEKNVGEVVAAGFRSVAVIRAIAGAGDPRSAAARLIGALEQAQ